jgi:hypothetical protein
MPGTKRQGRSAFADGEVRARRSRALAPTEKLADGTEAVPPNRKGGTVDQAPAGRTRTITRMRTMPALRAERKRGFTGLRE